MPRIPVHSDEADAGTRRQMVRGAPSKGRPMRGPYGRLRARRRHFDRLAERGVGEGECTVAGPTKMKRIRHEARSRHDLCRWRMIAMLA
eukprot:NODE_19419_length_844_cov_1.990237.p4 GENE.NODE_19419_length_844_cov_1.990237~~NODE_19419_length_844_cov_1.990237.p4  ORF type:complete len:89 (+),score=11.01 NODE_19419_length_844_cov_1.990237:320-586(+)